KLKLSPKCLVTTKFSNKEVPNMFETNPLEEILHDQLHIPGRLLTNYTKLGLNETELVLVLQLIYFFKEKNNFPTPAELAEPLTISEKHCSDILMKLIQKDLLTIEPRENEQGQISEAYSVQPLLEKLYSEEKEQEENTTGTIFILFEQEFGRPIS